MHKIFMIIFALFTLSLGSSAGAADMKEWTVLVFLNADNSLYNDGLQNFAEMEKIGSSDQVNVLVQFDPEPVGQPTKRYYVTKNPNAQPGHPTSKVLQEMGETDMGDPKVLSDFLVWGATNFPAKHYAVVIWNHGDGWEGVSYDDHPSDHLDMPRLKAGLLPFRNFLSVQRGNASLGKIDVINFDACLMSAMEVAYELKDEAQILVGSQFLEPGPGEDYTTILAPLVAKPTMLGPELADTMVYQYTKRYASEQDDINYSAIDLTKLVGFTQIFSSATDAMLASPLRKKIVENLENPADGGFDLVGSMAKAQNVGKQDPKVDNTLQAVISSYGYPNEDAVFNSPEESHSNTLLIRRNRGGIVYYRFSQNSQWQNMPLVNSNGGYEARIPKKAPLQYFVTTNSDSGHVLAKEAIALIVPRGADPIVYHNQFPASSPLIADAHSMHTKGAHGMTLYSLAGMEAAQLGHGALSESILAEYMRLDFAISGDPNWIHLFGR